MLALLLAMTMDAPEIKQKPALAPVKDQKIDISGYYTCRGKDAGGKKYSGICTIIVVDGVYVVSWHVGPTSFTGVGMQIVNGTKNTLSVGWATVKDGQVGRGVNHYDVYKGSDGKPHMVGRWCSLPGSGQVHTETLAWLKEIDDDED